MNQLLERYLGALKIEDTTRNDYERLIRLYIRPLLGDLPIGRIDGETLDAYYAELRRCRARCDRRARVDHRTDAEHECDHRCGRHVCEPLGAYCLRQIHTVLNGAFTRAVRLRWIGVNPVRQAEAPPQPPPDPQPPSPTQAARIVGSAWNDPAWGMFVWLAMTTGARRGELCALRGDRIDFSTGVVDIRTAVAQINTRTWEKDTKTHQRRRIVADPQTLALLRAYLQHTAQACASLGIELAEDSFVFSGAPDQHGDEARHRHPALLADVRTAWLGHAHPQLRHYPATELIAAGVDIRTVAGRLGHGGGATTTLRVYSAWVAEADQRAASSLAARMPLLPVAASNGDGTPALPAATIDVRYSDSPYRQAAADLRAAIRCGALGPGTPNSPPSRACPSSTRSPRELHTGRRRYSTRPARSPSRAADVPLGSSMARSGTHPDPVRASAPLSAWWASG